jgi:nucleoside-diphosphate-sugar epimerase
MSILITGGAGYIGSALIGFLLDKGHEVVAIDSLVYGDKPLLSYMDNDKFTFYKGDVSNEEDIKKVVTKDVDAIVHLAAIVGDPACKARPDIAKKTNWDGSTLLVNYADKIGVKRFIFASTCSNYGKMKGKDILDETSALSPVSLYAELKVRFEKYLLEKRFDNIIPTILRFATVYGTSPRMRFDLTVNHFTKDAFVNKKLVVFGENFWRPYCHVKDIIQSIVLVLAAEPEKMNKNVFNVGSTDENYTKKMICEEILKIMPDTKVEYVSKDEDPRDYKVNFNKIKTELGFKNTMTVPDGISEVYSLLKGGIISNPDDIKYRNV